MGKATFDLVASFYPLLEQIVFGSRTSLLISGGMHEDLDVTNNSMKRSSSWRSRCAAISQTFSR